MLTARRDIMKAQISVPEAVIHRGFSSETVVMNLDTGNYHSLNRTGGRMFEALNESNTVAEAAGRLSEIYERPVDELSRDLCVFCVHLERRGLIELTLR